MKAQFKFEPDSCCSICNPVNLADYETECVMVEIPGHTRLWVCSECIGTLVIAHAARREVFTEEIKPDVERLMNDLKALTAAAQAEVSEHQKLLESLGGTGIQKL